jgi:hypothetical protein
VFSGLRTSGGVFVTFRDLGTNPLHWEGACVIADDRLKKFPLHIRDPVPIETSRTTNTMSTIEVFYDDKW